MAMVVAQVDMRVISGSGTTQRLSIGIDEPTNFATNWPVVHLQTNDSGTTWRAAFDAKDVVPRGSGSAIAGATGYNIWRTVRAIFIADSVSVYVDGVLVGTFTNGNTTANSLENRYLTLGGFGCNGDFRNLQVWDAGTLINRLINGV